MHNNTSIKGIKFRRFIYRLSKYCMFALTAITCFNLTSHIIDLRSEKLKREKRNRIAVTVLSVSLWFIALVAAVACLIKYVKHFRKGYLLDLFDTEAYDVIDPEEEFPAESIIKSELCGIDDAVEHEQLISKHIPLDEDASEEDY